MVLDSFGRNLFREGRGYSAKPFRFQLDIPYCKNLPACRSSSRDIAKYFMMLTAMV